MAAPVPALPNAARGARGAAGGRSPREGLLQSCLCWHGLEGSLLPAAPLSSSPSSSPDRGSVCGSKVPSVPSPPSLPGGWAAQHGPNTCQDPCEGMERSPGAPLQPCERLRVQQLCPGGQEGTHVHQGTRVSAGQRGCQPVLPAQSRGRASLSSQWGHMCPPLRARLTVAQLPTA